MKLTEFVNRIIEIYERHAGELDMGNIEENPEVMSAIIDTAVTIVNEGLKDDIISEKEELKKYVDIPKIEIIKSFIRLKRDNLRLMEEIEKLSNGIRYYHNKYEESKDE